MLKPSAAHMWTKCALSASIGRTGPAPVWDGPFVPDPDDDEMDARREGTAADWVANGVLRGDASCAADYEGETAPNGWIVTPDMVTHVQGYIDYCRSRGPVVRAQVTVSVPHLQIRGFCDAQVIADSPVLELIDLKYGWRVVEAEFNAQLLCEAIALFDPEKHDRVILTVYQPRPSHPDGRVRSWEMDEQELTTAYHWLAGKAAAANSPNAQGSPSGEYCRDCEGSSRCEALARASYAAFEWVRGSRLKQMTGRELGNELQFADEAFDLIKAYRSGLKAEAAGRMKRGEYIDKWAWDLPLRDREFTVPLDEVETLTGIEPFKRVPMSPAEMERAGADLETIKSITIRAPGAPKLVRMTPKSFARLFPKPKGKSHGS